jgi:Arm DNA-binding domain
MLTETEVRAIKPLRYSRKVSDGGGLYLLVTPKGGRCWRYAYRFAQKQKTLALGIYPDVSLERARSRHEFARNLLAHGLDPSALKAALGKHTFAATMREWEKARGDVSALPLRSHARNRADQAAC